jgi:hypothetical protein
MADDIITPGSGAGGSEEAKRVVGGWNAIKDKNRETRAQRILRESNEKAERVKQGLPAEKDTSFRPGEDEASGEFNMRRAREAAQNMVKKTTAKQTFVGSADMVCLKVVTLCEEKKNVQILGIEEAGFGNYRVSYIVG